MTDEHTNDAESDEEHAANDDDIRSLGEDRYVITPDGPEGSQPGGAGIELPWAGAQGDEAGGIADLDGAYALALDARFEGVEDDLTVETNDVSAAFEALLRWYAGNVADGTPPEAVVATLLENSELDVAARPSKSDGGSTSR